MLEIDQIDNKKVLRVGVRKLDLYSAVEIKDRIIEMIDGGSKSIVLNLENVVYIDSSGLGSIINICTHGERSGGQVRLTNLSEYAKSLFDLSKVSGHLKIYATEEDAVKASWD